ncbi:hypothetical protein PSHO110982_03060 [Pseudostreptobacillus hongkongensis]
MSSKIKYILKILFFIFTMCYGFLFNNDYLYHTIVILCIFDLMICLFKYKQNKNIINKINSILVIKPVIFWIILIFKYMF